MSYGASTVKGIFNWLTDIENTGKQGVLLRDRAVDVDEDDGTMT